MIAVFIVEPIFSVIVVNELFCHTVVCYVFDVDLFVYSVVKYITNIRIGQCKPNKSIKTTSPFDHNFLVRTRA